MTHNGNKLRKPSLLTKSNDYHYTIFDPVNKKIELLAPGGNVDSIKAAIVAGADAIYCGLMKFNARNRAANISFDELQGLLRLAHQNNCQIFLTLNILILESEIPDLIRLLNRLVNTSIDGVIVQDLGLLYILSHHYKGLIIHASTQLTTHNEGQLKFLNELAVTRVNLSRELNLNEIKKLTYLGHELGMNTEVFVHGSYCISFSGICYMSSVIAGKSGNRGACSQPCRDPYETTAAGRRYPLNLKDNSAYYDLKELAGTGVSSLKIEGRIKDFEYVYTVVNAWRKQIDNYESGKKLRTDNSELYKVFNRDFTNAYLRGSIDKEMFIDNPMSHSLKHLAGTIEDEEKLFKEKAALRTYIQNQIESFSINKIALRISVSGESGRPLIVVLKTPDKSFIVSSEIRLANKGNEILSQKILLKRLNALNESGYYIESVDFENLPANLYFPFSALTALRNKLLLTLNGGREYVSPVHIPVLQKHSEPAPKAKLSVLISSSEDIELCAGTASNIYYHLPDGFRNEFSKHAELFKRNKRLLPWFPSVLIGDDFLAAKEFLKNVQADHIVTNNTGIAYEAYQKGIPWIAGPFMNAVNSYTLKALKEQFKCSGAFISNEIKLFQIKKIKKPEDFDLYYSIYHPLVMMTSRQCLFHPVTECEKNVIDNSCIANCEKTSSITDLKKNSFFISKTKGNYHNLFNEANYLNTDIITDLPDVFTSFFIDLRDIRSNTKVTVTKSKLLQLFENLLASHPDSDQELKQNIRYTTSAQYIQGI